MLFVLVAMLVTVGLAAAVAVYVAFPHRGSDVPRASWLGDAMRRGVDSLPTLDPSDEAPLQDLSLLVRTRGGK